MFVDSERFDAPELSERGPFDSINRSPYLAKPLKKLTKHIDFGESPSREQNSINKPQALFSFGQQVVLENKK